MASSKSSLAAGEVAMFPRAAINSPALFASTCILFDSVTVLKPIDIEATRWSDYDDDVWDYCLRPNKNAESFWKKIHDLVTSGFVRSFEVADAHEFLNKKGYPDQKLWVDHVDTNSTEHWVTKWYAVGFSAYFDYLTTTQMPVILSAAELQSAPLENGLNIFHPAESSTLSSLATRILSECLPDLAISHSHEFAGKIHEIREKTENERIYFKSFIGLISGTMSELLSPEEKSQQLEQIIHDYVSAWQAYRGKLGEVSRRLEIPLRFASIINSFVTMNFVSAAEKIIKTDNKDIFARQEQRSFGFLRTVDETNRFWLKK